MSKYTKYYVVIFVLHFTILISAQQKMSYELPELTGIPYYYSAYTVLFNKTQNIPEWVAWELNKSRLNNFTIKSRESGFTPDPNLGSLSPKYSDYTNSGYDRGHMCPANDCRGSASMLAESFYMSNVCPQMKFLNQHSCWRTLEDKCQTWILEYGAFTNLYIICGPVRGKYLDIIYSSNGTRIQVPAMFFKGIIGLKSDGNYTGIAFLFKQDGTFTYSSIDDIENIIEMNLFASVPKKLQDKIEKAKPSNEDWPDLYIFHMSHDSRKNAKDLSAFIL